jgi:hypothetical protein
MKFFLGILQNEANWDRSTKRPNDRAINTFASTETVSALRMTIMSIIQMMEYLRDILGFDYVLTAKFNQDCLEVQSKDIGINPSY